MASVQPLFERPEGPVAAFDSLEVLAVQPVDHPPAQQITIPFIRTHSAVNGWNKGVAARKAL